MSAAGSGERPWADPRFWAEPGADDAREARHELLADMLAAYVDDELPPETASQLDAHLVGCGRCRRDVRLQLAVRGALTSHSSGTAMPNEAIAPVASAALRARVAAITSVAPPSAPAAPRRPRWRATAGLALAALVATGVPVAWAVRHGAFAGLTFARGAATSEVAPAAAPLLAAAIADYRRAAAGDLPGRARDLAAVRAATGLAAEPLGAGGLRLLGAWTTTLDGERVAALAYRWNDRLVVEYIVPEQLYFRSPATRAAAASGRRLLVTDGAEGAVAWPVAAAGAVLVGAGPASRVAEALAP